MNKRLILCAAVLLAAGWAAASQEGSWSGVITDTHCGKRDTHTAACVNVCVKEKGARYALASAENGKLYILEPQEKAASLANENVKVTGTLEGDTIQMKTIEKAPK